jgi:hypothetical protein
MSDDDVAELKQKIANLERWLEAERQRREATEERLRDARDELRQQLAEMSDMQKVNGQLRGKIARLESEAKRRPRPVKKPRR